MKLALLGLANFFWENLNQVINGEMVRFLAICGDSTRPWREFHLCYCFEFRHIKSCDLGQYMLWSTHFTSRAGCMFAFTDAWVIHSAETMRSATALVKLFEEAPRTSQFQSNKQNSPAKFDARIYQLIYYRRELNTCSITPSSRFGKGWVFALCGQVKVQTLTSRYLPCQDGYSLTYPKLHSDAKHDRRERKHLQTLKQFDTHMTSRNTDTP